MRSFFIYHKDGSISLYEYRNKELSVFKNKGEIEQTYDPDAFWDWWRDKVEYQDEEISFFIMTDQDSFDIPSDIRISKENILSKKIVHKKRDLNFSGLNSIYYPIVKTFSLKDSLTKKYINIDTLTQYSYLLKILKNTFLSSISFMLEKFIFLLMQIPKIVWNKIEKIKEERAKKLEQFKIKSETRL